jgi:23S rRNA-/tRNA-specific pseudouridylate synthase
MMKKFSYICNIKDAGLRVDNLLKTKMNNEVSRSQIKKSIENHGLFINGKPRVQSNYLIKDEDKLLFEYEE